MDFLKESPGRERRNEVKFFGFLGKGDIPPQACVASSLGERDAT